MQLTKINILLVLAIIGALCASLFLAFVFLMPHKEVKKEEAFDPAKILATLNTEDNVSDYLEIEKMIGDVMKKYGTRAGFELIDEGEKEKIISNDQCHGYLHYVGHAAFLEHKDDYEALLNIVEGTSCIGGYLHGIEAEIVLTSSNVVKDVQDFCAFQKEKGVNPGPCYHGVGHAAAELYKLDIQKTLLLCDSLKGDMETDLTNCYRGVFSEIGNLVTGYDGHTGLEVDKVGIPGLTEDKPFDYCNALDKKYQSSCISQLLKVLLTDIDQDKWIEVCLDPTFDTRTQEICTNITAGVYMRSHLSFNDSAVLPTAINNFPESLRKIAMMGTLEAFFGYFSDNAPKDWKPFCEGFTRETDKSYCVNLFEKSIANNEAPWMELDIR